MENYKRYLAWAIIIVLFIFAYASVSYVRTYDKSIEPSSFRSFSVSGEGEVVAVPDVAQFKFSVITEGEEDVAVLQEQNTTKINAAIEFLKTSGVEAKDIKTQIYDVSPRYQTYPCERSLSLLSADPCPPAEIVGYTVTQSVLVKIRDFNKIGDIITGIVAKGINDVGQLSFIIDDPETVRAEAREEAISKAREKAETVAKAAGFSVGRLLSIYESGYSPVYYDTKAYATMRMGGAEASIPAPTIEPGSQDVTVNVTMTYEIK